MNYIKYFFFFSIFVPDTRKKPYFFVLIWPSKICYVVDARDEDVSGECAAVEKFGNCGRHPDSVIFTREKLALILNRLHLIYYLRTSHRCCLTLSFGLRVYVYIPAPCVFCIQQHRIAAVVFTVYTLVTLGDPRDALSEI